MAAPSDLPLTKFFNYCLDMAARKVTKKGKISLQTRVETRDDQFAQAVVYVRGL